MSKLSNARSIILVMLIGDVGGIYSLFASISISIQSVINYNKSENLLIGDLFKANDRTEQQINPDESQNILKPGK